MREMLAQVGEAAGFDVRHDYSESCLAASFANAEAVAHSTPGLTSEGERILGLRICEGAESPDVPVRRWNRLFVQPKLDVVWGLRLPARFREFLRQIRLSDPDIGTNMLPQWGPEDQFPLIGFEVESSRGKHGAGGILNLARHAYVGVLVVPEGEMSGWRNVLRVYSAALGIHNVHIVADEEVRGWLDAR
jgi:hypothetical protein